MDRLDYVSMLSRRARLLPGGQRSSASLCRSAPSTSADVRRDHAHPNHLLWLGAHGLDIGAMTVFPLLLPGTRDLMDCYEAVVGRACTPAYYRPGAFTVTCPTPCPSTSARCTRAPAPLKKLNENRQGSLLDFIEDFTAASEVRGRVRDAVTDNRI